MSSLLKDEPKDCTSLDCTSCIKSIINHCEKHIFGQTTTIHKILGICSEATGYPGCEHFCTQIITLSHDILAETYKNSHSIINLCKKLSSLGLSIDKFKVESVENHDEDEDAPVTTKSEPADEGHGFIPELVVNATWSDVESDNDVIHQRTSDSEDNKNHEDDHDWSADMEKKSQKHQYKNQESISMNGKSVKSEKTKEEEPNSETLKKSKKKKTQKVYQCSMCSRRLSTLIGLKSHEAGHKNKNSMQCEICNRVFMTPDSLKRHARVHTGERPYICEVCGNSYPLLSTLQGHMLVHTDDTPFHCQLCEMKFKSARRLRKHQQVHSGEKKFQCDTCGDRFAWACSLKKHLKTIHSDEWPFQCELCPKKFKIHKYLKKHEQVHTDEYKYQCKVCGKRTRQKSNLDSHMRTHNGQKPYSCDKCGKRFAHNVTRKQHMESCFGPRSEYILHPPSASASIYSFKNTHNNLESIENQRSVNGGFNHLPSLDLVSSAPLVINTQAYQLSSVPKT